MTGYIKDIFITKQVIAEYGGNNMTITLFITILTIGSAISSLLTEAIKKAYINAGKECSPNIIALVDALLVGGGVTAGVYVIMGIEWTVNNIICLLGMIIVTWIASMVGYDKVLQSINQIINAKDNVNEEDNNSAD